MNNLNPISNICMKSMVNNNFINNIRSKKRYGKWPKKVSDEDLDIVCKTYNCNATVGKEYLDLLSREQLDTMKKEQEQGGTKR